MADWGGGMSACCKPQIQLFADAGNGWQHNALRYHWLMPISCHFQDCESTSGLESCKNRYIASTGLYLITFICLYNETQAWG